MSSSRIPIKAWNIQTWQHRTLHPPHLDSVSGIAAAASLDGCQGRLFSVSRDKSIKEYIQLFIET